jgi:hypothetical protein
LGLLDGRELEEKGIEENPYWVQAEVLFTEDSATSKNTNLFNF